MLNIVNGIVIHEPKIRLMNEGRLIVETRELCLCQEISHVIQTVIYRTCSSVRYKSDVLHRGMSRPVHNLVFFSF